MTAALFLITFGVAGGIAYWAYWWGYGEGMRDGLIAGGELPALGKWAELVKDPDKFIKPAKPKVGLLFEMPEDVAREFGGDENKLPWIEFVRRYNAALRREGREAEQIEAIPSEVAKIPEILESLGVKKS